MYNKSILIGRMTADPELKQTGTGVHVIGFSIAVDRKFVVNGERKTDFINIVAWRQHAEFICKYFHKGDPIGIEGAIQVRNYEDKTGAKRTAVEVVVESVFFAGGKKSTEGNSPNSASTTQTGVSQQPFASSGVQDFEEIDSDDDLPF